MTPKEKQKLLKSKGWHTWYHPDYWVHTKLVKDRKCQDYTNYGLNLDDAYEFETQKMKPFNGQFLGYMGGLRW